MKYTLVVTVVLYVAQPEADYEFARMSHEMDFGSVEHCEEFKELSAGWIERSMAVNLRSLWGERELAGVEGARYVETRTYCDRR